MEVRRASGAETVDEKGNQKKRWGKVVELQDCGEGDKEKGGALGRFAGVLPFKVGQCCHLCCCCFVLTLTRGWLREQIHLRLDAALRVASEERSSVSGRKSNRTNKQTKPKVCLSWQTIKRWVVEFAPGELTWIKAAAPPGPALIESHKASAQNCAKKHSIAIRSGLTVRKEMHMLLVARMWHVGKCVRTASNNEQPVQLNAFPLCTMSRKQKQQLVAQSPLMRVWITNVFKWIRHFYQWGKTNKYEKQAWFLFGTNQKLMRNMTLTFNICSLSLLRRKKCMLHFLLHSYLLPDILQYNVKPDLDRKH